MADLPSSFWGGWIVAITVTSFVALVWLIPDRRIEHLLQGKEPDSVEGK